MTPWYIKAEDLYGDQLLYLTKLAECSLFADSDEDCYGYLWNMLGLYSEPVLLNYDAAEVDYKTAIELTKELSQRPEEEKKIIINFHIDTEG